MFRNMPPQLEKALTSPLIASAWASILIVVSAFLCLPQWHGLFSSVPEERVLQKAEGSLSSFQQFTNAEGLRFRLSGSENYFILSAYSGAEAKVRRSPPGAQFSVLYDPRQQRAPVWSSRRSYVAFVVYLDGSPIRTYENVAVAARQDMAWVPWLGAVFGLSGLATAFWAVRLKLLGSRSRLGPQKAS
jgi:hypothetical protein